MIYRLEAMAETLKGIVTCGSREGYTGRSFGLPRVEKSLDETNVEVARRGLTPLPCIITSGKLVGRSEDGGARYTEGVYRLEFALSPRSKKMSKREFQSVLIAYAEGIGSKLKQERVYVEFGGKTSVIRKIKKV
jgi:hypothetical protein